MNTGSADERKLLADVARIAKACERVAEALELLLTTQAAGREPADCDDYGPDPEVSDVDPRKRFVAVELPAGGFHLVDLARQAVIGYEPDRETAEFKVEQLIKTWTVGERS